VNVSDLTQAFAQPNKPGIIDLVMPDGRGAYSEHSSGRVTLRAVKAVGRIWAWEGFAGMSHDDKVATVRARILEMES